MEDAVRVGIVFPRSGQQLFVTVSRQVAMSLQARAGAEVIVYGDR